MSDSVASLRKKIANAGELQSVVRTMKALAASSIGQYEASVLALADYARALEMCLSVCFREIRPTPAASGPFRKSDSSDLTAVVFGSDQGLVGQFNEAIADHAITALKDLPGKPQVWAVGERVRWLLADAKLDVKGLFAVPTSVQSITQLVGEIQLAVEARGAATPNARVYVFHNQPKAGALYEPIGERLLPLDDKWRAELVKIDWPTGNLPELLCPSAATLGAFISGHLFIAVFKACAESLASENASRLAAMQRAEKNIDELLESLQGKFHSLRQSGIDEELFDVVSGFEALSGTRN